MRTFESLQSSPTGTTISPELSGVRTGSADATNYPPGFEELGVRRKSRAYSTIRRKEVIHANIKLAGEFLREQSNGLSKIQQTLMLWSKSRSKSEDIHAESIIFMQPIESTLLREYLNVPLFGDGTEDPLKLHYLESGRRLFRITHFTTPKPTSIQCFKNRCLAKAKYSIEPLKFMQWRDPDPASVGGLEDWKIRPII